MARFQEDWLLGDRIVNVGWATDFQESDGPTHFGYRDNFGGSPRWTYDIGVSNSSDPANTVGIFSTGVSSALWEALSGGTRKINHANGSGSQIISATGTPVLIASGAQGFTMEATITLRIGSHPWLIGDRLRIAVTVTDPWAGPPASATDIAAVGLITKV